MVIGQPRPFFNVDGRPATHVSPPVSSTTGSAPSTAVDVANNPSLGEVSLSPTDIESQSEAEVSTATASISLPPTGVDSTLDEASFSPIDLESQSEVEVSRVTSMGATTAAPELKDENGIHLSPDQLNEISFSPRISAAEL